MNERDSEPDRALDALWREHSTEMPSAALDDAIRAAARRAVNAKPVTANPARTRTPWPNWARFAAAASIGIFAVGVWQLQPRESDVSPVAASTAPTQIASSEAASNRPREPQPKSDVLATREQKEIDTKFASAPPAAIDARRATALPPAAAPARQASSRASLNPQPAETSDTLAKRAAPAAAAPPIQAATSAPTVREEGKSAFAPAPASPSPAPLEAPSLARASPPSPLAQAQTANRADKQEAGATAVAANTQSSEQAKSKIASVRAKDSSSGAQDATASAPAGSLSAARSRDAPREAARSINDFVEAIGRARTEHRDDEALSLLAAMRSQYPDADTRLPTDLRQWAATVPRVASPSAH